ncbi:subtilisin inhibitor CLSI-I-like [Aegilops tauschii subsp. strangulata]
MFKVEERPYTVFANCFRSFDICKLLIKVKLSEKMAPPSHRKTSWPEVVGMPATPAVMKIMTDRPDLSVEVLPPGTNLLPGANPGRVRVFIDALGAVTKTPVIG